MSWLPIHASPQDKRTLEYRGIIGDFYAIYEWGVGMWFSLSTSEVIKYILVVLK